MDKKKLSKIEKKKKVLKTNATKIYFFMGYGDLQFYDIVIFAAIAAFLLFRLRKVLGRRTGFKKNNRE